LPQTALVTPLPKASIKISSKANLHKKKADQQNKHVEREKSNFDLHRPKEILAINLSKFRQKCIPKTAYILYGLVHSASFWAN